MITGLFGVVLGLAPLVAHAAPDYLSFKTEDETNNIEIFKNASPSVVFVTNSALYRTSRFNTNVQEVPQGSGTGFVWDKTGLIVTNAHVIEGANPRHEHEWKVWESVKLPKDKILIPGVISHATNIVEHPELVSERIQRYARNLGRENVIASTDCGYSQGWNIPRVHPQVQWAKLKALGEGARLASAKLWRQGGTARRVLARKPLVHCTARGI